MKMANTEVESESKDFREKVERNHGNLLFQILSNSELTSIILHYLVCKKSIVAFDIALTSKKLRPHYFKALERLAVEQLFPEPLRNEEIKWISTRKLQIQHVRFNSRVEDMDCLLLIETYGNKLVSLDLNGCRNLTDQTLINISKYCTNLNYLTLLMCEKFTDKGLIKIAQSCQQLETLLTFRHIGFPSIVGLSFGCRQLHTISLSGGHYITDDYLELLSDGCHSLIDIDLDYCDHITDHGITLITSKNPYIQKLSLRYCHRLQNYALLAIAQHCHQLHTLKLAGQQYITDMGLHSLSYGCMKLETIYLSHCHSISDQGIASLAERCLNIHSINLNFCEAITDQSIISLSDKTKKLHYISLQACCELTDVSVLSLSQGCLQLKEISMSNLNITDFSTVEMIHNCIQLTCIDFSGCTQLSDLTLYAIASHNKYVETIGLANCRQVTEKGINILLQECHKLRCLRLEYCRSIRQHTIKKWREQYPHMTISY